MAFAARGAVTFFPKQQHLQSSPGDRRSNSCSIQLSTPGTAKLGGKHLTWRVNKQQGLSIKASSGSVAEEDSEHTTWVPSRAKLLRAGLVAAAVSAATGDAAYAAGKVSIDDLKGNAEARDRAASRRYRFESNTPDFLVRPDILAEEKLVKQARQLIKDAQKEYKDKEAACALFDKAVQVAPSYAPAWGNRAVFFYNQREFIKAAQDIKVAYSLEAAAVGKKNVDPVLLNTYGDISLATEEFTDALRFYGDASKKTLNPAVFSEASIGYIFTLFEMGFEPEASRNTRKLLKKATNLYDMEAFLVASEWCVGREEAAIGEWEKFQTSSPYAVSYNNTRTVAGRWPPKAVAALDAFNKKERKGVATTNYDIVKTFSFDCNDPETKPHWRRAACRNTA